MNAERVKVADAARFMGVSEQFIRIGLQRQSLPIGNAVKMRQWCYYISKPLLESYVGKKMPSAETEGSEPKRLRKDAHNISRERGKVK